MNRTAPLALLAILVAAAGSQSTASGRAAATLGGAVAASARTPIRHVVILLKENRSFDEYFGRFPGANGATTGRMSNGQIVTLQPTPDPMPNDVGHSPDDFARAFDGGAMDGFDLEDGAFSATGKNLAYTQMSETQIPNYWAYAKTYALGDAMFAPWKGGSFPNNVFSVAAQSGQYDTNLNGRWMWGNVPRSRTVPPPLSAWGCDSPPDTLETMLDAHGTKTLMFPCFGFRALPNVLSANAVSWRFYAAPSDGQLFAHNGLDALRPVRNNSALWSHVVSESTFVTDAAAGHLPNVSWVVGRSTEHPVETACAGENETVRMVNAIMNGPDWLSTAIFIYWDEWGGFYDHVRPRSIDGVSYGFRVPLLVISPYTKKGGSARGGSISHTFYSALSVLKFIETNWNVPSLTPKDQGANTMMDLFNFTATPRPRLLRQTRTCPQLTRAQRRTVERENPD